jgi:hypothetical protein
MAQNRRVMALLLGCAMIGVKRLFLEMLQSVFVNPQPIDFWFRLQKRFFPNQSQKKFSDLLIARRERKLNG